MMRLSDRQTHTYCQFTSQIISRSQPAWDVFINEGITGLVYYEAHEYFKKKSSNVNASIYSALSTCREWATARLTLAAIDRSELS